MSTEIQQLLLNALTDLTKEYQQQSNEQIEREKTLICVLAKLQSDQTEQSNIYQTMHKSYIESLQNIKQLEFQMIALNDQNRQLTEQLERLLILFRKIKND